MAIKILKKPLINDQSLPIATANELLSKIGLEAEILTGITDNPYYIVIYVENKGLVFIDKNSGIALSKLVITESTVDAILNGEKDYCDALSNEVNLVVATLPKNIPPETKLPEDTKLLETSTLDESVSQEDDQSLTSFIKTSLANSKVVPAHIKHEIFKQYPDSLIDVPAYNAEGSLVNIEEVKKEDYKKSPKNFLQSVESALQLEKIKKEKMTPPITKEINSDVKEPVAEEKTYSGMTVNVAPSVISAITAPLLINTEVKEVIVPVKLNMAPAILSLPVPLEEAEELYQTVHGTSKGSRYTLLAVGHSGTKMAARITKSMKLSVRVAGPISPTVENSMKELGMTSAPNGTYHSAHFQVNSRDLMTKTVGAIIAAMGITNWKLIGDPYKLENEPS